MSSTSRQLLVASQAGKAQPPSAQRTAGLQVAKGQKASKPNRKPRHRKAAASASLDGSVQETLQSSGKAGQRKRRRKQRRNKSAKQDISDGGGGERSGESVGGAAAAQDNGETDLMVSIIILRTKCATLTQLKAQVGELERAVDKVAGTARACKYIPFINARGQSTSL